MSAVQILASLGFTGSSVVSEAKGKTLLKIWTSKGWCYERVPTKNIEDEITTLARRLEPGARG